MPAGFSTAVDKFLAALTHPRMADINVVRQPILAAHEELTEQVKWNAPSFCIDGDDRITMRLQPKAQVQVILHCGARAKTREGFSFDDPDRLARWIKPDRGVVDFRDQEDIATKQNAFACLVRRWAIATR